MKRNTVLDLNAGLGGRIYAFKKAGFEIVGAVDADVENCEVITSWLDNSKVINENLLEMDMNYLPDAEVIMAKYIQQTMSVAGVRKQIAGMNVNDTIYEIIAKKRPEIFLLEVPVGSIISKRQELEEYIKKYIEVGYDVSYVVYDEMSFSGYPVVGKQGYIIGSQYTNEKRFEFPEPIYQKPIREIFYENPQVVAGWYRNIRCSTEGWERGEWYFRFNRTIKKTQQIHMGVRRDNYLIDSVGPRKFTHNEFAMIKGLCVWDYNGCKNKYRMYEKIASASNVYVVENLAKVIYSFIQSDRQNIHKNVEAEKGQKQIQKNAEKVIFPKIRLKEVYIKKLKGINNLSLKFDKDIVAIMGVNGSGKSTILHALACIYSRYEKGDDYKFSDFFTPNPDASWKDSCFTVLNWDENKRKSSLKKYEKKKKQWTKYADRPRRDAFFIGIASCIPEIEIEKKTSFINYVSNSEKNKINDKIIEDAAYILNKDYKELLSHTTGKKKYIGVQTKQGIIYSALSMGAGEQRVIKLLHILYDVYPYSLILIDEIDLLLHADAFRKLVIKMAEIAKRRNLQIVFTTHSLEMQELGAYADIRYIEQCGGKMLVYDSVKPELLYKLSGEIVRKYTIYVEDDFAEAIVRKVAQDLNMQKHINIIKYGSIENAFTVASGKVLAKEKIEDILVVTDGDKIITQEEKIKQVEAVLTGTEVNHEEKVNMALSIIKQFNLPSDTPPEKYVHDMLIEADADDECVACARNIISVSNSHYWIDKIVEQLGTKNVIYSHIMNIVAENERWASYVDDVRKWLLEKREEVRLNSLNEDRVDDIQGKV